MRTKITFCGIIWCLIVVSAFSMKRDPKLSGIPRELYFSDSFLPSLSELPLTEFYARKEPKWVEPEIEFYRIEARNGVRYDVSRAQICDVFLSEIKEGTCIKACDCRQGEREGCITGVVGKFARACVLGSVRTVWDVVLGGKDAGLFYERGSYDIYDIQTKRFLLVRLKIPSIDKGERLYLVYMDDGRLKQIFDKKDDKK